MHVCMSAYICIYIYMYIYIHIYMWYVEICEISHVFLTPTLTNEVSDNAAGSCVYASICIGYIIFRGSISMSHISFSLPHSRTRSPTTLQAAVCVHPGLSYTSHYVRRYLYRTSISHSHTHSRTTETSDNTAESCVWASMYIGCVISCNSISILHNLFRTHAHTHAQTQSPTTLRGAVREIDTHTHTENDEAQYLYDTFHLSHHIFYLSHTHHIFYLSHTHGIFYLSHHIFYLSHTHTRASEWASIQTLALSLSHTHINALIDTGAVPVKRKREGGIKGGRERERERDVDTHTRMDAHGQRFAWEL